MTAIHEIQQMYWDAVTALRERCVAIIPGVKWGSVGSVPNGNCCMFEGTVEGKPNQHRKAHIYRVSVRLENQYKLTVECARVNYQADFYFLCSMSKNSDDFQERINQVGVQQILIGLEQTRVQHGEEPTMAVKNGTDFEQPAEFEKLYQEFIRTAKQFNIDVAKAGTDAGFIQRINYIRQEMCKASITLKLNPPVKHDPETAKHTPEYEKLMARINVFADDFVRIAHGQSFDVTAAPKDSLGAMSYIGQILLREMQLAQCRASEAEALVKASQATITKLNTEIDTHQCPQRPDPFKQSAEKIEDYTQIVRLEGELNAYKAFIDRLLSTITK